MKGAPTGPLKILPKMSEAEARWGENGPALGLRPRWIISRTIIIISSISIMMMMLLLLMTMTMTMMMTNISVVILAISISISVMMIINHRHHCVIKVLFIMFALCENSASPWHPHHGHHHCRHHPTPPSGTTTTTLLLVLLLVHIRIITFLSSAAREIPCLAMPSACSSGMSATPGG